MHPRIACWWTTLFVSVLVANSVISQSLDEDSGDGGGGPVDYPYPTYNEVPKGLPFTCADKIPGYYADPDTRCQVWHWCLPTGQKYSFLCPNGTVFNQAVRVCDWFYNVNCPEAISFYNINTDLYKDAEGNLIKG